MGSVGSTGIHSRTLYRGVSGPEYIEDIFNPNTPTHMSPGIHGDGLYFTANKKEATGYGRVNEFYSGKQSDTVAVQLDLSKAKIIEEQELIRRMKADGLQGLLTERQTSWMAEHGYNVVYSKADGYYVVKDKSVLIRK